MNYLMLFLTIFFAGLLLYIIISSPKWFKWIKRIFKGCLWTVLFLIIISAAFLSYIIITAPKMDKNKEKEIERLFNLGQDGVPGLLKFLDDSSGLVRYEVITRFENFHDKRTLDPLIKELQTSNDEVPRKTAAHALGVLGDTGAVMPLINALSDSSFHVRYKSADALGKIGDIRALEPLIKIAENDEMEYVSIYAENAIIDICEKSGIKMPAIKRKKENISIFEKIKRW